MIVCFKKPAAIHPQHAYIVDCCDDPAINMIPRKTGRYKGAAREAVIICVNHEEPKEIMVIRIR